jgi:hypothetical protein
VSADAARPDVTLPTAAPFCIEHASSMRGPKVAMTFGLDDDKVDELVVGLNASGGARTKRTRRRRTVRAARVPDNTARRAHDRR